MNQRTIKALAQFHHVLNLRAEFEKESKRMSLAKVLFNSTEFDWKYSKIWDMYENAKMELIVCGFHVDEIPMFFKLRELGCIF